MNLMNKINKFDALVILIVALFLLIVAIIYSGGPRELGQPILVKVAIEQNDEVILPEAQKMGTVYLNGQKQASKITDVEKDNERILITIEGLGTKEDEVYIFNGQRVLVGQKAELHGGFWAQGYITEINIK
jgi:hypothetical protein